MGNKVKYNLKNVHAAKLTETVTGGVTSYSYATPQAIPGAVSISLDAEGDSSPFYADGIVYFRSYANNGYSGDLEIALIPEWFRTEILKETLDTNGVLVERSNNAESVKFALLFEFDGFERLFSAFQLSFVANCHVVCLTPPQTNRRQCFTHALPATTEKSETAPGVADLV